MEESAHRDEGEEAGKGFLGFDFFVRNPNHTGEAKPGTILKGKKGEGNPSRRPRPRGIKRLPVNVLHPLYGRLGCCRSSKPREAAPEIL